MKRLFAFIISVAMILCSFSGCAEKINTDAGKVKLDVIISQYGNYTQDWWKKFEKDFEATYNDVDLNVEIVDWDELYTVVNTRITTNQVPDILNIDTFADYVADDLLMPVEEYASEELIEKVYPSFMEANEIDGTVWALPILASVRALFSNMDILNEAGISEPPTTWDEVFSTCEAIQERFGDSIVPWALDISTDEGQADFAYYAWNNNGGFTDENGNWNLNSKENIEALEFMKKLFDSGYCNADPYNDTKYPLQDAFSAGSQAMIIAPCNLYDFASDINFKISPIPTNGELEPVNMGVCDRLLVFKDESEKNQDARTKAITEFFDYFYDVERYSDYMVFEGFLPVTKDSSEMLSKEADKFIKGGSEEKGDSEYFSMFCELLASCQFYPAERPEWIDVKQGIIDVEQRMCQGEDITSLVDNLQESITKK